MEKGVRGIGIGSCRLKWKNTGEKGGRKFRVENICHFKSSRNLVTLLVACPFILARICSLLFEEEADPRGRILFSEEQKAGKRETADIR
jgi:hypothetical protein